MTKLSTADHVGAIIRILSADGWLADISWESDRDDEEYEFVTGPNRVTKTSGRAMMVEIAPKTLEPTGRRMWEDRAAWERDPVRRRYAAPFAKSGFKRLTKRKVGDEVRRTFSMPNSGIEAHTFESDGAIARVEFHRLHKPYVNGGSDVIRTVPAADIPADTPQEAVGYDVVDAAALETLVTDAAIARLIEEDGEYETPEDVRADYDPFKFETAVHNGFPYSRRVEDDLSRVQFDAENTEIEFDAPGFEGFNTIGDLTFLGVMAGGDWESPVVFILYPYGGELRGYVPDKGNHYDRKHLRAWGNGDSEKDEEMMEACDEEDWDVKALRADVARHFGLKV